MIILQKKMQRRNKNRDERQAFPSELGRSVTDGVEIEDLQYQAEKSRPPYGTILIAAFFFIAGTVKNIKLQNIQSPYQFFFLRSVAFF